MTATDFLLRRIHLGPRLLKHARVQHLRHLLARLETARECLIHELHGKILSDFDRAFFETAQGTSAARALHAIALNVAVR
jgi:hypothetical protein